jgi:hypothetical protein
MKVATTSGRFYPQPRATRLAEPSGEPRRRHHRQPAVACLPLHGRRDAGVVPPHERGSRPLGLSHRGHAPGPVGPLPGALR